jgi:hypothetical protein
MVFFLLCALWAIVRRRWFAAGFGLSLSVLVWQPVFWVGMLTAAVAILALRPRELLRAAVRFVPGGLVPLAVLVVYFTAVGALNEFVQAFLLIPRKYQTPSHFADHLHGALVSVRNGFGPGPALTLLPVAAGVAFAVHHSLGRDNGLIIQQHSVDAALAQLPAGASILSIEAPQPLVLSGMTNPTRHQTFSSGLDHYVEDHYPGGLRGYADFVARDKPTLIAIGMNHGTPDWLLPMITSDYEKVGEAPKWTWYARRSLGPDVLAALRSHV